MHIVVDDYVIDSRRKRNEEGVRGYGGEER